jgi:hypothetical protein
LPKGTPVYQVGVSGFAIEVDAADASDISKMPAIGVLGDELIDDAEGDLLLLGAIKGVDTSAFDEGDEIFVAVGGGFTNVKPEPPDLIQFLGIVTKISPTNGGGEILGTGRIDTFIYDDGSFYGWNGTSWEAVASGGGGSLPDQTGNDGKYLSTDGTDAFWAAINKNVDGGAAASTYLVTQNVDGGNASG